MINEPVTEPETEMRLPFSKPKPGYHRDPGFAVMKPVRYRDVLDRFEALTAPDWYLEIGSRSCASLTTRKCSFVAIDPVFAPRFPVLGPGRQMHFMQMESDAFFASGFLARAGISPDFAFIDGMHQFEFALRDFMNCEAAMRPGGHVFLHDVAPYNHAMTTRDTAYLAKGLPWTGDVWKVMAILHEYRPDLTTEMILAGPTGLGCVSGLDPENTVLHRHYDEILARFTDLALAEFGLGRYLELPGWISPDDFLARFGPV